METIGLFFKETDRAVVKGARELLKQLEGKKYEVKIGDEQAKAIKREDLALPKEKLFKSIKFLLAVGGDGTMLRAARFSAAYDVPILGVNLGKLGFLTEIELSKVADILPKIVKGQYYLDERMMIEAQVRRKGGKIGEALALNEVVISKSGIARIVKLDTYVGKEKVTTYSADGLIISTPTGSTGHDLSAGGPILTAVKAFIITAICPFSIANRSIVLGTHGKDGKPITIKVHIAQAPEEIILTADGQLAIPLKVGDHILVRQSKHTTKFIRLRPYNFFEILRSKLGWG